MRLHSFLPNDSLHNNFSNFLERKLTNDHDIIDLIISSSLVIAIFVSYVTANYMLERSFCY